MKNSRFLTLLTVPFLAFSLVACDDDDAGITGNEGDPLTQTEAEAMADVVLSQGLGAAFGFGMFAGFEPADPGILAVARAVVDEEFGPVVEDCPRGGDVTWNGSVTGQVDDQTGEGDLDYDFRAVHDECGLTHEEEDLLFVFTGDDRIDASYDFVFTEEFVTLDGRTNGGLLWELEDGREGRCAIDVNYDLDFDFANERVTGTIQGSVCGTNVDDDFDEPFAAS